MRRPFFVTRYIVGNTVQVLVDRLAGRLDAVEQLPAGERPAALLAPVVALRRRLKEAATDDEKHELRLRIEALLAPIRARVCAVARGPRPFAYALEFPEVFFGGAGGFAAVVGNPPYVKVRARDFEGIGLASSRAGNLYAYILENGIRYLRPGGRYGMITQHALACTYPMEGIQQYMLDHSEELYVSTFDRRPNRLFRDANIRHAIAYGQKKLSPAAGCLLYTTTYQRWYREEREGLLQRVRYADASGFHLPGRLPKIGEGVERTLLAKIRKVQETLGVCEGAEDDPYVFFRRSCCYWLQALAFIPFYQRGSGSPGIPAEGRLFRVRSDFPVEIVVAFLNSALFYWYWLVYSDCRHVDPGFIRETPFPYSRLTPEQKEELTRLAGELMEDLVRHKVRRETRHQQAGRIVYDEFYPRRSKPIIDRIDDVLAGVYGLTDEELAFVKTYQQRFRMDEDDGAGEEDDGEEADTA